MAPKMAPIRRGTRGAYIGGYGPALLFAAVALLPTACVMWVIGNAIHNQGLLLQEKLADAYQGQLSLVRERVDQEWSRKSAILERLPGKPRAFAEVVNSGLADSVVILNSAGAPIYPVLDQDATESSRTQPAWNRVRSLEETNLSAAASAYIDLGKTAKQPGESARAIQAAARCLMQAGKKEEAARLIMAHFGPRPPADPEARAISANALLMAVHFLKSSDSKRLTAARRLHSLLTDYDHPGISSSQRIFLMKETNGQGLPPELVDFPTLKAEELAMQLLENEPRPYGYGTALRASRLPGLWVLASSNARILALFREETILSQMRDFVAQLKLPAGIQMEISPPNAEMPPNPFRQITSAGERMGGWKLVVVPIKATVVAGRQFAMWLWIGVLVIAALAVLAIIAGHLLSRSLRLAGLKSDLVAVVSHELKTPLSSMRLLVDTLLDESVLDQKKTREYLGLVAGENARLSLVIENFLAFSRMERNKYALHFAHVSAEELVQEAVGACGQRFCAPDCQLQVEVMPGLPDVLADRAAIVTALINLLDNAYKYTPAEKHISLRAYQTGPCICFEVSDNGIGIPRRDVKKIFQRFYQADWRLSRRTGGCGLGLSIVRFLIEAHGGNVQVSSEAGKGSRFTVVLEAAR